MRRDVVVATVVSSVLSILVTAGVILAFLPTMVEAQVTRLVGTSLTLARDDGLAGVTAEVRPAGGGQLQVLGTDGKTLRVNLGAGGGGDPFNGGVIVNDMNGGGAIWAGVHRIQGGPSFLLRDAQGNIRYAAVVDAEGNPSLQLLAADGTVLWSAP